AGGGAPRDGYLRRGDALGKDGRDRAHRDLSRRSGAAQVFHTIFPVLPFVVIHEPTKGMHEVADVLRTDRSAVYQDNSCVILSRFRPGLKQFGFSFRGEGGGGAPVGGRCREVVAGGPRAILHPLPFRDGARMGAATTQLCRNRQWYVHVKE